MMPDAHPGVPLSALATVARRAQGARREMNATLKQRYYPFPPRNATGEKNLSKFRGLFVLCSTPPPTI